MQLVLRPKGPVVRPARANGPGIGAPRTAGPTGRPFFWPFNEWSESCTANVESLLVRRRFLERRARCVTVVKELRFRTAIHPCGLPIRVLVVCVPATNPGNASRKHTDRKPARMKTIPQRRRVTHLTPRTWVADAARTKQPIGQAEACPWGSNDRPVGPQEKSVFRFQDRWPWLGERMALRAKGEKRFGANVIRE